MLDLALYCTSMFSAKFLWQGARMQCKELKNRGMTGSKGHCICLKLNSLLCVKVFIEDYARLSLEGGGWNSLPEQLSNRLFLSQGRLCMWYHCWLSALKIDHFVHNDVNNTKNMYRVILSGNCHHFLEIIEPLYHWQSSETYTIVVFFELIMNKQKRLKH